MEKKKISDFGMLNSCVIILQNIAFDLLRESIVAKGRNLGRTGSSM